MKATCLEGGSRHVWKRWRLDVLRGRLVSVRRCVWCLHERTTVYHRRTERLLKGGWN